MTQIDISPKNKQMNNSMETRLASLVVREKQIRKKLNDISHTS